MGTTWGSLTTWSALTSWWSTGTVVTPPPPATDSDAGNYWSPYNTVSPLYSKQRVHRPCQVQLGFRTEAGVELKPAFTGYTRDLATRAAGKDTTLTMLDNAERMRGSATLPAIVADDLGQLRYGLSGSFVVDYAARHCGFYSSPPQRPGVVLSATMAGSAWPEVGAGLDIRGANGPLPFVSDPATVVGNYLSDNASSFETSVADWSPGGSVPPTLSHSTTHPASGSYGMLITWATGGVFPGALTVVSGLTPGRTYIATAQVWVPSGSPGPLFVVAGIGVGTASFVKDAFSTITITFTATLSSHGLGFWANASPVAGQQCWIDLVRVIDAVSPQTDLRHRVFTDGTSSTALAYTTAQPISISPTNGFLVEIAELGVDATGGDIPLWHAVAPTGTPQLMVSCWVTAAGVVKVGFGTFGSPTGMSVATGPTIAFGAASVQQYLAVNVSFGNWSTCSVDFRLGSTTTTSGAVLVNTPGEVFQVFKFANGYSTASSAQLYGSLSMRGVQVTQETAATRAAWNDTFTPSAVVGPSLSTLTAIPQTTGSWWDVCSQIAAAEFATVEFDESGLLKYANRARWTTVGSPVRTLTSLTSVKDFTVTESIDSVRNIITIPATPISLSASQVIWDAVEAYAVPAGGSLTVSAFLDNPAGTVDMTWRSALTGLWLATPGQSQYRANSKIDGSGTAYTNLTFSTTMVDAQTVSVTIYNPNSGRAYLVHPTGGPQVGGSPALEIWGKVMVPATGRVAVTTSDAGSIGAFGEQSLDIPDTPWRQSLFAAQLLGTDLLRSLRFPGPQLMDLQVIADPDASLGDLVQVVDTTGMAVNHTFWIVGLRTTFDGAMSQVATLRPAQKLRTGWVLGVTDHLGVDTILL